MDRIQAYLQAYSSLGIGAIAFALFTDAATWAPIANETLDAALFAASMLVANLCMAFAARYAYRTLPHTRMRWRALQALLITLAFVGILRIDLGMVINSVASYTDTGVIAISQLATMITWVTSFTLVWTAFIAETENSIIAKIITLMLACLSAALFFAEPVTSFLDIQADHEVAVSKYAITCLGLAVAISAFASELRSWRQQVNINQATVAELKAKLPFLTHRQSRDIVAARRKQPFESIEQLRNVAGIDDETFKAISPHARI
jgi:hypothetical protein